jgi:hypothetical protein
MMNLVLNLHSLVRWVITLVALVALIYFLLVWLKRVASSGLDRTMMVVFVGLIDLEVLLGLLYFLWTGIVDHEGFPTNRIEHAVTMLIAAAVAHLSIRWRNAEAIMRARNNALLIIVVAVLVGIGISFFGPAAFR